MIDFATPQEVLKMTYVDFRTQYLRKKGPGTHFLTRVENNFNQHIVCSVIIDPPEEKTLRHILDVMRNIPPDELLSHPHMTAKQVKMVLKILREAGVILRDIPEYKKWDKNTEI